MPCGNSRPSAQAPQSCWRAALAKAAPEGRQRQNDLKARRRRDAASGAEHDRACQRQRPHRAVRQQRTGDGRHRARHDRACVAERRHSWLAAVAGAQAQGIGFSKLIATGNECDLEVADFIDYLADDPTTKVIALYLEGLRKPKAFQAAVSRARTRRQAGRRLQGRPFRIRRAVGGVAYRRARRLGRRL